METSNSPEDSSLAASRTIKNAADKKDYFVSKEGMIVLVDFGAQIEDLKNKANETLGENIPKGAKDYVKSKLIPEIDNLLKLALNIGREKKNLSVFVDIVSSIKRDLLKTELVEQSVRLYADYDSYPEVERDRFIYLKLLSDKLFEPPSKVSTIKQAVANFQNMDEESGLQVNGHLNKATYRFAVDRANALNLIPS